MASADSGRKSFHCVGHQRGRPNSACLDSHRPFVADDVAAPRQSRRHTAGDDAVRAVSRSAAAGAIPDRRLFRRRSNSPCDADRDTHRDGRTLAKRKAECVSRDAACRFCIAVGFAVLSRDLQSASGRSLRRLFRRIVYAGAPDLVLFWPGGQRKIYPFGA